MKFVRNLVARCYKHADNAVLGASILVAVTAANAVSTTPAALGTAITAGGTLGTDVTTDIAVGLAGFVFLKKILGRFRLQ